MFFARPSTELPYVGKRPRNPKKIGIPFGTLCISRLFSQSSGPLRVSSSRRNDGSASRLFAFPKASSFSPDGQETQIPLLLDKARPVQRIHVDLTPLNVPDESGRQFSVRIGQHQAGNWNLKNRSTVALEIPDQAWTEGSFTRRIVPLVFKWEGRPPPTLQAMLSQPPQDFVNCGSNIDEFAATRGSRHSVPSANGSY